MPKLFYLKNNILIIIKFLNSTSILLRAFLNFFKSNSNILYIINYIAWSILGLNILHFKFCKLHIGHRINAKSPKTRCTFEYQLPNSGAYNYIISNFLKVIISTLLI